MPTYTYECKKCAQEQDLFHGINAKPRVKCLECGGACRRLIGKGAGIIFKGSGFYETDYKNAGKNGGEKKKESTSESSAEGESSSTKDASSKSESSKKTESPASSTSNSSSTSEDK